MPASIPCNGRLLRYYREQRGWTQIELAVRAGYSERLVRKAESDGTIRPESLEVLALALSTPQQKLQAGDLTTDPLAVAQAFIRGYLQHGVDSAHRCAHLFAPDVVNVIHTDADNLAFGGEFHGVDGLDQMFRRAYSQFTPVEEDFGRWFTEGQRAIALRHEVLKPAGVETDVTLSTWILHEYTVVDGLIARTDTYVDSLAWSRYLVYRPGEVQLVEEPT
jgi:hypothetical protein